MQKSLNDVLQWRYATKIFDESKKVSEEDLNYILEAGNLMPTAYGLQPFTFISVKDTEIKEKLAEAAYGQRNVADNSHLIVLAARTNIDAEYIDEYVANIESTRKLERGSASGFADAMKGDLPNRTDEAQIAWSQKQVYIALGGMIVAASEKGIDNHALEGFSPEEFTEILGLGDKNLLPTVILAIGYRSDSDDTQHWAKVRKDFSSIVIKK